MTFAVWLVWQRKRRMLTQTQAADQCGVQLKTWQSWEQGVRRPSRRNCASIIRGLGIAPCDWRQP